MSTASKLPDRLVDGRMNRHGRLEPDALARTAPGSARDRLPLRRACRVPLLYSAQTRRRLDADGPDAARCSRAARAIRQRPRESRRCTAPSSTAAGCRRCARRAARARATAAAPAARGALRASLRASASAHFSTSPGGSTPSSSRSWPELPPLSNIVTMAFRRSQGLVFRPPSRLGRPVPPPKHPMLSWRRLHRTGFYAHDNASAALHDANAEMSDSTRSSRDLQTIFGDAPADRSSAFGARRRSPSTCAVVDAHSASRDLDRLRRARSAMAARAAGACR